MVSSWIKATTSSRPKRFGFSLSGYSRFFGQTVQVAIEPLDHTFEVQSNGVFTRRSLEGEALDTPGKGAGRGG